MIILFPQCKAGSARSDCADEKAGAENPPPSLQHCPSSPTTQSLLPLPSASLQMPVPLLRLLDARLGPLWGSDLHCMELAVHPHPSLLFQRPQPCSLGSSSFHRPKFLWTFFKYMINNHLELNHIFQFDEDQFLGPSASSLSSFPKESWLEHVTEAWGGCKWHSNLCNWACNQLITDEKYEKDEVGNNIAWMFSMKD